MKKNKPMIKIIVKGGLIQEILTNANCPVEIEVHVCDFDCEGTGGNAINSNGDPFNHSIWNPDPVSFDLMDFKKIEENDENN